MAIGIFTSILGHPFRGFGEIKTHGVFSVGEDGLWDASGGGRSLQGSNV